MAEWEWKEVGLLPVGQFFRPYVLICSKDSENLICQIFMPIRFEHITSLTASLHGLHLTETLIVLVLVST